MKRYRGYLLDLDGTVYRGNRAIPEAVRFVEYLKQSGLPFLYLTNNSSQTAETVAERLTRMGLPASPEEVYTSAMATADWLSEREPGGAGVLVIGEEGLRRALTERGFTLTNRDPAYVVVGIDRAFTYDRLAEAARAIRSGAVFVATNRDPALPTEDGLMPGNGSLVAAVAVASGCEPVVIGKPEPGIVRYALQRLGCEPQETLIVGDNLHTDIEAGANCGMDTLLVLTGYSTREDAERYPVRPTYVAADLAEWQGWQEDGRFT